MGRSCWTRNVSQVKSPEIEKPLWKEKKKRRDP